MIPPRNTCLSLAMLVIVLAFAGCGSNKPGWASLDPNDWSNQRQSDDPLVLELEGPISLDIDTFAGDVVIEADPKRTNGEVTIVREGLHGFGRSKDAKASLADISASVEIVAADTSRGELGQTLRIRTSTTNAESYLQRAHVYVKAPAIDGVFVHTDDGNVTATHVEGTMDIETSNGTVSVRSNLALTRPITIINKNGDIILRTCGESTAAFDAQTIDGRVSADIRFGSMQITGGSGDDTFRATLNSGKNRVILRTTNADIKIAVLAENEKTILLPSHHKPPKEPEEKPQETPPTTEPATTPP